MQSMKSYRTYLKEFKTFIALAVIVLLGMGYPVMRVSADDFSDAKSIAVNTSVIDNLNSGNYYEQKYYMFSVEDDGYFTFQFSNPLQGDTNAYWIVYFYNQNYDELCNSITIYGNTTLTKSPAIGISAGTYYVKIISTNNYTASTDNYTISVNYETSDFWEKELNESFLAATEINTDTKYYGSLTRGNYYESDYYRFDAEQDGYVILNFTNPQQGSTSAYWLMYLYNGSYEELWHQDIYGNSKTTDSIAMGIAAGTYYVKIISTNNYTASTDTYGITVNYTKSNYWEKEFNNSFNTALPINHDMEYYGVTSQGNYYEQDNFSFVVEDEKAYSVEMLTPDLKNTNDCWIMQLYDGEYKEIGNISIKGNKTSNIFTKNLPADTYYIKIISTNGYTALSTEPYRVKVYKAKILKSISAKKSSTTYVAGSNLVKDDITVTAQYTDGSTRDVTDEAKLDISKVDMNKSGSYIIYVSYENQKAEIPISVTESVTEPLNDETITLQKISAKKTVKTYFVGDKLATNDITVTAQYTDGSTRDVTGEARVDTSKVNMNNAGSYIIYVTYEDKSASIEITVTKKEINTLKVTAKKNSKKIKIKTIDNVKLTITSNRKIFKGGKKKYTVNLKSKNSVNIKLSSKLKRGTKLKVVASKEGYYTKTVNKIIK